MSILILCYYNLMDKEIYLSVIIPAYNEEKRLPETLKKISAYLKIQSYSYEIIVVSDGSKDQTAAAANSLDIKNLTVIDNKKNHGKGYVVRQGMLKAKGKYRLFTDADNATSVDQVEKMWPLFAEGFQIVIGSRDIKGADVAVPQPWWRVFLGNIFNLAVQTISGLWGIWDTQCGFKGFTGRAAEDIFSRCRMDRFAFDVEVLSIARILRYKMKEIPVTWINDVESKVNFKSMIKMLLEVLEIRLNVIKGKYKQ